MRRRVGCQRLRHKASLTLLLYTALVSVAPAFDIVPMPITSNGPYGGSERRSNPRLRELVDEMLASIRAAANVDLWTSDERSRYEAEMARIMESVREHAIDHGYRRGA